MHCESGKLPYLSFFFFTVARRAFKGAGQHTDGFYMIKLGKYRYETGFSELWLQYFFSFKLKSKLCGIKLNKKNLCSGFCVKE